MIHYPSPLALFLMITLTTLAVGRPLLTQDFAATTTLGSYINATNPGRGQFTDISAEASGGTWSIANGALRLVRTGDPGNANGAGITRKIGFAPESPGMLCLRIDVTVAANMWQNNALILELGNFTNISGDYNSWTPDADTFGRLTFDLAGSHGFKLKTAGVSSGTVFKADGVTVHTLSCFFNQTGFTQTYRAPNGSVKSLGNNCVAVWITRPVTTQLVGELMLESIAVHDNLPAIAGANSTLNNVRLRWSSPDNGTWRLDNLRVENALVPTMYGLPAERFVEAKARIAANDPSVMTAFNKLISEAETVDTAAEMPLKNVTMSTSFTFGGDTRNYYSIGTYWWPVDGDPQAPWVQRDGYPRPQNDVISDIGAFRAICDAATTLSLASYLTPDPAAKARYAAHAAALVREWFLDVDRGMRPTLQYAAIVPNHSTYGHGRAAGIIDSVRLIELADSIALLSDSPLWTQSDHNGWKDWLNIYLEWLTESTRGQEAGNANNNHGTWYDAQRAQYALMTGENDLARSIIVEARTKRLSTQVALDGSQPAELARPASLDYSAFNILGMLVLAHQAEWLNIDWTPSINGRSLRKAIDYIAPYANPARPWSERDLDSPSSHWGDRKKPREVLGLGASFYSDSAFVDYRAPFQSGGYSITKNNVTTYYPYLEERWQLFEP